MLYGRFFDRIVDLATIVKPSKVLLIAIDGPAPLAKQAQQRQRRYLGARDRGELSAASETSEDVPEGLSSVSFDSAWISPGTPFMHELSRFMHFKLRQKLDADRRAGVGWAGLQVVFSGHVAPGEGEHKIMDFIRRPENREARHCFLGPTATC